MNTLTHWNPFKRLARFDPASNFDELFRSLGGRMLARDFDGPPDIPVDVTENDALYSVKAQIAGVDKNDIEVSVDGNQVAISAEVKREANKEGEQDVCIERYYGKAYRAFTLPSDLDAAKAEARYENGVLTLTLPKKRNGGTRRIAVS